MGYNIPRGTQDILPGESDRWQYVEQIMRDICRTYQYKEIRTPIFEHTELFARGVGESTDIVQKEMYTFEDRKGRSLTLRPEGTAAAVRAFNENKLFANPVQPTKLYYVGRCSVMNVLRLAVTASFISLELKRLVRKTLQSTLK